MARTNFQMPPTMPAEPRSMSVRQVFRILLKRKYQIVAFAMLTVLTIGGLMLLFDKPIYTAKAQLLLEVGREHIFDPTLTSGGELPSTISFDTLEEVSLARAILSGRTLLGMVVQEIGADRLLPDEPDPSSTGEPLAEAAIRHLNEKIELTNISNSTIVDVRYQHSDPETSALVVDTLTRLYLERYLDIRSQDEADEFFREQFDLLAERLATAENALYQFKSNNGLLSTVATDRDQVLKLMGEAEGDLRIAEVEQSGLAQRLGVLRGQLSSGRSQTRSDGRGRMFSAEVFDQLQEDLVAAEANYRSTTATLTQLEEQLVDYAEQVGRLDALELEYSRLSGTVEIERENYYLYTKKFEESKILDAMDAEGITSVRVLETASVPTRPEDRLLRLALAVGLVIGVFGGAGLAMFLDLVGGRIDSPADIEGLLGVPVLALVGAGAIGPELNT